MIAQQYLQTPLLVDGYKFDLRLYVLVLSCSPMRILLFKEGLARFCTERYRVSGRRGAGRELCGPVLTKPILFPSITTRVFPLA
jgi:hypothetical protein